MGLNYICVRLAGCEPKEGEEEVMLRFVAIITVFDVAILVSGGYN